MIRKMQTIVSGTATINGINGADWQIKNRGKLPEYYITKNELSILGWRTGDKVSKFAKGKMLTRGKYMNMNKHLPSKDGREWFEADINYLSGKRDGQRILWSNDGLIFVNYDHYETFYEIV